MTIKRSREEELTLETLAMANCVNILEKNSSLARRLFECRTCKKQFESFQALGGHRESHKKPKLNTVADLIKPNKKKHEFSYCGEEFSLGQALGGHMRKHRHKLQKLKPQDSDDDNSAGEEVVEKKISGTEKALFLDLNLTPYENELMLGIIPLRVVQHSWL
ncbi:zinc finger protein ZAT11-like [Nicotiana sylvestris]|uniref:Zinc finger protein ZAT11-like n=1 Tax=Nicotiana sylvestris TaxID=4096 RepID=A0A1U7WYF4_NICSY|nr:PREDICTED: zinc finger protein ZAT11-like [Nicotiana sylvestris]XP_009779271.1 PREDICTED: zinc finger protein ZAT11-like [Nicotiana sylvestris]